MQREEKLTEERVTTNTNAALAEQGSALEHQPPQAQVRGLARLCRQLSQQYQFAPDTCLERGWWRLFNQAGSSLRDALDHVKAQEYQGLSDEEAEQAYFLLIHVAYYFAPGGVAETLWPLLKDEPAPAAI
jgi:hypothetical protein